MVTWRRWARLGLVLVIVIAVVHLEGVGLALLGRRRGGHHEYKDVEGQTNSTSHNQRVHLLFFVCAGARKMVLQFRVTLILSIFYYFPIFYPTHHFSLFFPTRV